MVIIYRQPMNIRDLILNPIIQRTSAALFCAAGVLLLVMGMRKDITLVLNGEPRQVSTYALTVRGALRSEDLALSEQDRLVPSPGAWLKDGDTVYLRRASKIEIQADGKMITLQSAASRPENVLLEAGFAIFPKDRVLVDGQRIGGNAQLAPGQSLVIQILRGTPITLITHTGAIEFVSDGDSLADAFEQMGFKVLDADQLSRPLDTPLDGSPISVEWIQADPLHVQLADRSITVFTTAETVGAALAGAGIALQGLDYSLPAESEPIPDDRQVKIVRVREEILLNQQNIQFSTTYQPDDNTELDQLSILSGGEFGISAQRYRVTYEDGREISRDLEKDWILREPSPRVIGYGTKINLRTANTADGQITYWRKISAYATSYNENCPGCNDYTYSGAYLQQGVIAVTRDWYYYMQGMRVYIPGYGFATVEDIGAGVPWSTNWVDLGYRSENYVSWHQYVDVYFVAPAPPPENIMYILY